MITAVYNGIHRQQLFHWIGSHISCVDSKLSRRRLIDSERLQYVECLRNALVNGLWLCIPRIPDQLGDGSLVKVARPIVCFTEWSLGESVPHTLRYGRLGLGFSKRFVMQKGGQPVTYIRDARRGDPFAKCLLTLARTLKAPRLRGKICERDLSSLIKSFDYISHFTKRIRAKTARVKEATTPPKIRASPRTADPFKRKYGTTMQYLEEREWRIVYDDSLSAHFHTGPGIPEYYMPFSPGEELFTVALPDNRTVNMVLHDSELAKLLKPKLAPHVTILSLEDIGSF